MELFVKRSELGASEFPKQNRSGEAGPTSEFPRLLVGYGFGLEGWSTRATQAVRLASSKRADISKSFERGGEEAHKTKKVKSGQASDFVSFRLAPRRGKSENVTKTESIDRRSAIDAKSSKKTT